MLIKNITQKNYTTFTTGYQLKLPFNLEVYIPYDDSVRLLSQVIEEMDLSELYQTYSRIGENQVSPQQLLKILIYGYMNHKFSPREIETLCCRDINFMFLLEGKKAPDHTTISRFRSKHLNPVRQEIFARFVLLLKDYGEISTQQIFIDGTKIEAVSNKYTFVWKKAVTKHQAKLLLKICDFAQEVEEELQISIVHQGKVRLYHLKRLRKNIRSRFISVLQEIVIQKRMKMLLLCE